MTSTTDNIGFGSVERRHHGEVSMENFIKHQMMVILQPFIEQVQELDTKLVQLDDRLQRTDNGVASNRVAIDATNGDVSELWGSLKDTNSRLALAREGVEKCMSSDELLQKGVELANGHVARLHLQLEDTGGLVQELQRTSGEVECEVQSLRVNLQRTSDSVASDLRRGVDELGEELRALKGSHGQGQSELEKLRDAVDRNALLLHDTRKVLDTNNATTAALQKSNQDLTSRESQLSSKLEGWKQQWSKLHPALEAIRKDTAFLKSGQDHNEAVVHTLQQGYANLGHSLEAVCGSQAKLSKDVETLQQDTTVTQQGLTDLRDGLGKASTVSKDLRACLQKTDKELSMMGVKLDGLENRHAALCECVENTNGNVSDLKSEHRKSISSVQALQHELEKTNETVCTARSQLESTSTDIHGLKGELGRTNDSVQRLDHSVELCQAGFTGLQKGFVETGTHIASRPITLPKLPRGDDHRTPRQTETQLGSSYEREHRPSLSKPGMQPSAWIQDVSSTCASTVSQSNSRRSSVSGVE